MVHEYDASASNYLANIARVDLIKIRAVEVVELANGNPLFQDQRRQRVAELTLEEKKAVHGFLLANAKEWRMDKEEDLAQRLESNNPAQGAYPAEWYDKRIARLEIGADYLKAQFPSDIDAK